jgi:hypothetical protein
MRILRGLGGRRLACGCTVGVYETYDARAVAILDVKDPACEQSSHRADAEIDVTTSSPPIAREPERPRPRTA